MSKITLEPNSSGAGTFSIVSPDSNTNRTLTLPDEEGTVATIENIPPGYEDQDALDLFNVSGSAPVYACRAWVNFDGTGTVTIRDSGNVSSITDDGRGRYRANFTTSMPDNDFSAVIGGYFNTSDDAGRTAVQIRRQAFTTGSVGIRGVNTSEGTFNDVELAAVAIFR